MRSQWHLFSSSAPCLIYPDPGAVWPDLAKFRHFDKSIQMFGKILTDYFLFGKIPILLGEICDIIIFIVANGQILKNNLTIYSHCPGEFTEILCCVYAWWKNWNHLLFSWKCVLYFQFGNHHFSHSILKSPDPCVVATSGGWLSDYIRS